MLWVLKGRPPDKIAYLKIIFVISQPKQIFKLMDKKTIAILRKLILLNWPPSQFNSSLEHPKHMFKLMEKKKFHFYDHFFLYLDIYYSNPKILFLHVE